MALKKETIEAIAKLTKIKADDLQAAIADEKEVDLSIPDNLTALTEDEISTLKKNEYKNGKESGVEMAVKEVKQELNLDFQGKSVKGLVEAATKKAIEDAKIPANEKVAELQKKVETLQATVQDQDKKLSEKDNEVAGVKLKSELYKHIPAGASLENDEVIELMKLKGYGFEMKDGKVISTLNGEAISDKLSNAIPVKDVITGFLKEKKLVADGSGDDDVKGRGAGSGKPPVKFTKLSEIKAKFQAEGKSTLGMEFNEAVQKAVADNKEFDMQS